MPTKLLAGWPVFASNHLVGLLRIPLIVITSSGIMISDSGHRDHSPERRGRLSRSKSGVSSGTFLTDKRSVTATLPDVSESPQPPGR